MKPNWKAFAKEAYERGRRAGYEERRQEESALESEWVPITRPPKEPGRYLCRRIYEVNGRYYNETKMLRYYTTGGFSNKSGHIITHWLHAPRFPQVTILVGHESTVIDDRSGSAVFL